MRAWIFAVLVLGCTNESEASRILQGQGFTDISFTGYEPFDCSDDDTTQTGFRAKGPTGRQVRGTVCCGLIVRNCTVRFE